VLIIVFGALFFGWAYARGFVPPDTFSDPAALNSAVSQAFDLSWANVFKPLSALTEEATKDNTLADKVLSDTTPWLSFIVRALATLQSLLAIVLAFLFALAVRRRFQIS
jgi:hypothetical protein